MTQENMVLQEALQRLDLIEKDLKGMHSDINICLSAADRTKEVESIIHEIAAQRARLDELEKLYDQIPKSGSLPKGVPIPEINESTGRAGYPPKWHPSKISDWDEWTYLVDSGKDGSIDSWRPELAEMLKINHSRNNKGKPFKDWQSVVDSGFEYRITKWFKSKDGGKWNAFVSRRKIAGLSQGSTFVGGGPFYDDSKPSIEPELEVVEDKE